MDRQPPLCFSVIENHEQRRLLTLSGDSVVFKGGRGDQHPASGFVGQRETRPRAEEETRPQPAQRTQAEHHQELGGRTDLQRVCSNTIT